MIRIAKESDLPAVAAVYEAILDHEDATGLHYTGWKRGAYPTADTARNRACDVVSIISCTVADKFTINVSSSLLCVFKFFYNYKACTFT